MLRALALLAILLAGLAAAPAAHSQIGPRVPAPLTEPPPPPPTLQNPNDDRGLSTLQKLLIFGAAVLVLGTIAFAIVRDARRAAPVDERPHRGGAHAGDGGGKAGTARSARERERQRRAKRAKLKAAKRQRRRNRPH